MILLTDEEIAKVVGGFILAPSYGDLLNHIKDSNKAQLKKVVEFASAYRVDMGRADKDKVPMVYIRILEVDWQALLKEVTDGRMA